MGFLTLFVLLAFILGPFALGLPQASSTSLETSSTTFTTSLSPTASCMLACKNSDSSCQAACLGFPTSLNNVNTMTIVWTRQSPISSTLGNEEAGTIASPASSPMPQNSTAFSNNGTGADRLEGRLSAGAGAAIGIAAVAFVIIIFKGIWCWKTQTSLFDWACRKKNPQPSRTLTVDTGMGLYSKPELPGESSPTLIGEKMLEMQANEIAAHEVPGSSPEMHELPG